MDSRDEVRFALLKRRQIMCAGRVDGGMQEYLCSSIAYLNAIDEQNTITLFIDSTGGNTVPAFWSMDVIADSKAPVHGVVLATAQSAAFGILQACHKRIAHAHTTLMFHATEIPLRCDQDQKQKMDRFLLMHAEQITAFAKRSGQTEETWRQWSKEEREFTATEAFSLGIVDEVIPSKWF